MASNVERYTYRVTWSEEDAEFVGLCAEFPSLSHLDKSDEGAWRGIHELVRDVVEQMLAENETPPVPLALRSYSGEFVTRISPDLHRRLALEAAEQNESLNKVVTEKLARV